MFDNFHIGSLDTPMRWLSQTQPINRNALGFEVTREQLHQPGGGNKTPSDNDATHDAGIKREKALYNTIVHNRDMHTILHLLMKPACNTPWRLNILCKAAGIPDMRNLPRWNNHCYR